MKMIYSDSNRFAVFNLKNIVEQSGIQCIVKNDMISGAAGELPPTEAWPELWVVDDKDEEKAKALISRHEAEHNENVSWFCTKCSESNGAAFDFCWNCGAERH